MKTIKYYLIGLLAASLLQACYKDLGNYVYTDLDQIAIDTADLDILPQYAIYRYDTLKISPRIYLNGNLVTDQNQVADKLSFTWTIFQANAQGNIYSRDTLSHHMALEAEITKPQGNWIVHLAVKDLDNQTETYQRFGLQLDEAISDGWMVLYERNGNTDVGLIVDERVKNGVVTPRLFLDLIKNTNEAPLAGRPLSFAQSTASFPDGDILVASEHDYQVFTKSTFESIFSFEDLFFPISLPATKSLGYMATNAQRKEVIINDNRVYSASYATIGTDRYNSPYGVPFRGNYGQLADWIPTSAGSAYDAAVYDSTNKRFIYAPSSTSNIGSFPTQETSVAFNVNDVGLDLVTSDWGRGATATSFYEYIVMKNSLNTYLMVANFFNSTTAVGLQKYDITASPDAQNITSVSASLTGPFIYYSAENSNNVYLYLYGSGQNAQVAWSAPQGEVVTNVSIQKFYFGTVHNALLPNRSNIVHVATWDESNQNGKVYSSTIDPTNGNINASNMRVYEGFGKVKAMSYKFSL